MKQTIIIDVCDQCCDYPCCRDHYIQDLYHMSCDHLICDECLFSRKNRENKCPICKVGVIIK